MKLYLRKMGNKKWCKGIVITRYDVVIPIMRFCEENKVDKCDFKIVGRADKKVNIEGLPAIFG